MSLQERIINFIFSQRSSFTEEELVEKFFNLSKYRYSRNEIQEWVHCKIEEFCISGYAEYVGNGRYSLS